MYQWYLMDPTRGLSQRGSVAVISALTHIGIGMGMVAEIGSPKMLHFGQHLFG